ncbi:uncharacterized protein LOC110980746 [Acanthaster planci]|uniref:Uncharacterized protein LOC110980746 n=1 Tax=Acanthaster planci TaxID=133434 RepID=A0A8B7YLR1_ACAPL|nr:uncharacterized protein LOC110980746 [Acanthaster planci]
MTLLTMDGLGSGVDIFLAFDYLIPSTTMNRYFKTFSTLLVLFSLVESVNTSCPAPPRPPGTEYSGGNYVQFNEGQTITYNCTFGYQVIGPTTRRCTENGTWTGTDNVCRIDAVSLAIACFVGLSAIVIFIFLTCCLCTRNRRARRRAEHHLTIQRQGKEAGDDGLNGLGDQEPNPYKMVQVSKERVDRSDSGLQTDLDMEEIDLNNFDMGEQVDSPTDNNPPQGNGLMFIEE